MEHSNTLTVIFLMAMVQLAAMGTPAMACLYCPPKTRPPTPTPPTITPTPTPPITIPPPTPPATTPPPTPPVTTPPPTPTITPPPTPPIYIPPPTPPVTTPPPTPPVTIPPPTPTPPIITPPPTPPITVPPPTPPVTIPPPTPPATSPTPKTCPLNALKLGACVDVLGGLVHLGIGDSAENECCPVLAGVLSLEAALCLCETIQAKLLNLNILLPLALELLVICGKTPPPGFTCPSS